MRCTCAALLGVAEVLLVTALLATAEERSPDAFAANRRIGRGVNFGNALEAPSEGAWGLRLESEYFQRIKEAGFDSVRIPIRWSAHAAKEPPFTIDPAFFQRIDWAVDQALSRGLAAVINVHHFEELDRDPDANEARLIGLWQQIAEHYRSRPASLLFEMDNEPHARLTTARWNRMIPKVLAGIRATNPDRAVIVGPGNWNALGELDKLMLPEADHHLIATFHYYQPFNFTHQGASWVANSQRWLGKQWTGTPDEVSAIAQEFQKAAAWAKKHHRPLFLGEFGAFSAADMESRARWTRAIAREAERHGMSWAYWEFGAGFGVYDPAAHAWHEPLLKALLDK